MIRATVDTVHLREALASVVPHCGKDDAFLNGIRCTVTDTQLILAATNRYTAAVARADVLEVEGLSGSLVDDSFQLPASAAREVLALFKVPRDPAQTPVVQIDIAPTGKLHTSAGPEDFDAIRKGIESSSSAPRGDGEKVTTEPETPAESLKPEEPQSPATVTITDMTGLWPGKRYEVPADPHSPVLARIPVLVAGSLADRQVMPGVMSLGGPLLKLFAAATTAYNERMVLQATGSKTTLMCTVGPQFVGLLMPMEIEPDSDDAVRLKGWQSDWDDILVELS